jgi:two-component system, LuxR family, sensor kinase FixL
LSNRPTEDAETLALFVQSASDRAIFLLDPEGRITSWNRGAELVTGWKANEICGQPGSILYPDPEREAGIPEADLALVAETGRMHGEYWRMRKDGSEFVAHVNFTALRNEDGSLRSFGQVLYDITDRKASETAMERSAIHLRSILDTVPDAMVVIDEHGAILWFSVAAERMFGYRAADAVGRNVNMLMPSPDRDLHDSYLLRYRNTGEKRILGHPRIVNGRRADGHEFPIELSIGEAVSEGHRVFTGFIRDLSEQQLAELRLQELQSELIHVSRVSAMGTMASTLAHELNQPLTAIANYMEAARELLEMPGEEYREMVKEAMYESGREALRAGSIVRRLRDFVSSGDVEKHVEDLPHLIEESGRLALINAREKGVSVTYDLDPKAIRVLVDRVQIQQVLVNLLRNAVEAMEAVEQRALSISTRPDDKGLVRVSVADTGPGLAPAVQAKLFQAFTTTKETGMGLGLSICRTIIESHGGRIWAESEPGAGTTFHFTIIGADTEESP